MCKDQQSLEPSVELLHRLSGMYSTTRATTNMCSRTGGDSTKLHYATTTNMSARTGGNSTKLHYTSTDISTTSIPVSTPISETTSLLSTATSISNRYVTQRSGHDQTYQCSSQLAAPTPGCLYINIWRQSNSQSRWSISNCWWRTSQSSCQRNSCNSGWNPCCRYRIP